MIRLRGWACVLVAAVLATPCALEAQGGTTRAVIASVEMSDDPIAGQGIQEMRFGEVQRGLPGPDVPPGPAPASAATASGGWLFTNIRKQRDFQTTLTLPAALTLGSYAIPIDWDNAGYGTICIAAVGNPTCAVTSSFNPAASGGVNVLQIPKNTPGNNFEATVYVGARLGSPTIPAVPAGVYTAQVTLSFTYVN